MSEYHLSLSPALTHSATMVFKALAERVGFEPTEPCLGVRTLSKRVPSTTRPPLQCHISIFSALLFQVESEIQSKTLSKVANPTPENVTSAIEKSSIAEALNSPTTTPKIAKHNRAALTGTSSIKGMTTRKLATPKRKYRFIRRDSAAYRHRGSPHLPGPSS